MRNKRKENTIGIELVKDTELKKYLCDKYKFKENFLERMIVARAIGDSWDKIISMFDWDDIKEEEIPQKKLYFASIKNNNDFKSLVSDKVHEFELLTSGVEEAELVEKLKSIIRGEKQGVKHLKITHKEFLGSGKMNTWDEWVEKPLYPTVSEITRATAELHKLSFLNAKDRQIAEFNDDKLNKDENTLLGDMEKIYERVSEAEEMKKIEDKEIDMTFYDKLKEEVDIKSSEFSMEELADF